MADGVTRSPARLCSRRGKICYHKRLEYDFLTLCLAYCFSYFLMPYPGMFIFFVFLRLCSSNHLLRQLMCSQQVPFLQYVLFSLLSFASYPISGFLCFYSFSNFFVVLFSRVAFFVVLSYPVRQHLNCLPLFFSDFSFFSVSLSDHIFFLSMMKNQEGH